MKTFKEYAEFSEINELKIDKKSYTKFSSEAIKNINLMIEFGRKTAGLDNKQLNSLLDAIKNIHNGEDAIRISFEQADEKENEKKNGEKEKQKEKGEGKW
jgi:hypothetical protein